MAKQLHIGIVTSGSSVAAYEKVLLEDLVRNERFLVTSWIICEDCDIQTSPGYRIQTSLDNKFFALEPDANKLVDISSILANTYRINCNAEIQSEIEPTTDILITFGICSLSPHKFLSYSNIGVLSLLGGDTEATGEYPIGYWEVMGCNGDTATKLILTRPKWRANAC